MTSASLHRRLPLTTADHPPQDRRCNGRHGPATPASEGPATDSKSVSNLPRPAGPPGLTACRCKQCRTAKIKCSGSHPCERCTRRRDTCVFPTDEPHVSIPERYLHDLQRRVGDIQQPSPPRTADSDSAPSRDTPTRQSLAEYPQTPTQRTTSQPQLQESKLPSDFQRLPSSGSASSPQHAHARVQSNASIQSFDPALTNAANDSEPLPHNPLVGAASSSWMRDPHGRPRASASMTPHSTASS